MKALTIHQPWAWAIAAGHKDIENRSWATKHRGLLAIHAGSSRKSLSEATQFIRWLGIEPPAELVFGAVIAVADLVDIVDRSQPPSLFGSTARDWLAANPWAEDHQCWVLKNVRALSDPVLCAGKMGLFDLPADVAAAVNDQLNAVTP